MKFNYDKKSLFIKGKWHGFMLIYDYWINNGGTGYRAPKLGELLYSDRDEILYYYDGTKWMDMRDWTA